VNWQASNSSQNPAQNLEKNTDPQSNVSTFPGSNQNNIKNLNPKPNSKHKIKKTHLRKQGISMNEDTFFPEIPRKYDLNFKKQ